MSIMWRASLQLHL